jgi:hypothetical protein
MARKKTFINPLTRSSEEDLHLPPAEGEAAAERTSPPPAQTPPSFLPVRRRGQQAFEKTHQRFTGWMDKHLKQQLETLAEHKGVSKTSLLNEAIADLLRKYSPKAT